eukprot:COSAG06_NODE_46048_length_350_cov_0.589641_1_plen_71_part_10
MSIPEQQTVAAAADTVTKAVTTASILSHLKANRIEYIGLVIICHLLGLFFKQKTAYAISECDWSSDVCSSD